MKIRNDFVTNSSSSSFIISKNDVPNREIIVNLILEIANLENKNRGWDKDETFTHEDLGIRQGYDGEEKYGLYRYQIKEITENKVGEDYDGREYKNCFIVDNDDSGRYDWDAVEEVLSKHNIPWESGYCD